MGSTHTKHVAQAWGPRTGLHMKAYGAHTWGSHTGPTTNAAFLAGFNSLPPRVSSVSWCHLCFFLCRGVAYFKLYPAVCVRGGPSMHRRKNSTMLYHTMPYHTIPYNTVPYHAMLHQPTPNHARPRPWQTCSLLRVFRWLLLPD